MTERRIAISEVTTAEWSFEEDVEAYGAAEGVEGIGVWRDKLAASDRSADEAAALVDDHGLEVASLIFAGGFTEEFDEAMADARSAVEDAAALGAPVLLVLGGPRVGVSAAEGESVTRRALEELAPAARDAGVTLALEPLHPVDVTRFQTVVTLEEARTLVEGLDAAGVMFDTWNTWWDPEVHDAVRRTGGDIAAVHVSDWIVGADDPRNRAPPGEGAAPLAELLESVEATGYEGWYEVELFTDRYDPPEYDDLLAACVEGTRSVLPDG